MKFIDECSIRIEAGDGGNGMVAFRREKYIPRGGPSGGDGGRGGDVVFIGDPGKSTLYDLVHMHTLRAERGEHGQGKDRYGRGGEDLEVRVPVGTQVYDQETGQLVADITEAGQRELIAKGGRGGRGNIHFATPYDRAPRRAEPGEPGQIRQVRLELKVLADVGILGFPNVGKSTFIRAVSRARPQVADYPFTTLTPHLGVVVLPGAHPGDSASFVIADIPGLIPGASDGAGLGTRFLKHVERTRVLLHLLTLDPGEGREPMQDYEAIRKELRQFDPELALRPEVVALSKADLPDVRDAYPALKRRFARKRIALHLVSAASHEGLAALLTELYRTIHGARASAEEDEDSRAEAGPARRKIRKPAAARGPRKPAAARPSARGKS
jgi:GTP-binding protein